MKVIFPLLQLLAGLLLFSTLIAGYDVVGPEISQFQELGLPYPAFFKFLPVLNAVLVFLLILPLYRSRREDESWGQFFKRDWLGARLILAYLLPLNLILLALYHTTKIEEISVSSLYFNDSQLQVNLQKSLSFNIAWLEDQEGVKICFAKAPGRAADVQAKLTTALNSEQKPTPSAH